MDNNDGMGPFRYRKSIRCIAITDACIAFFMLTLFGLKFLDGMARWNDDLYPRGIDFSQIANNQQVPSLFTIISIAIFGVYALQLAMAQVLITATSLSQNDTTIVLSRCRKWYWTSQFLHVILGVELFIVVFSIRGGTPFAFAICVIKIVFRAVANHMVRLFMWDLRVRPPPFPFIATISQPFPPFDSARSVSMPHSGISIPTYEPPPSYEDAIKDINSVSVSVSVDSIGCYNLESIEIVQSPIAEPLQLPQEPVPEPLILPLPAVSAVPVTAAPLVTPSTSPVQP